MNLKSTSLHEVYTIRTRFGDINLVIPFICQKCGTCCRELSVPGFRKPCKFLDNRTNLCKIYEERPSECRAFPFFCDAGWSKARHIGCPATKRFDRLGGVLLSGYSSYSSQGRTEWKKMNEEVYEFFLKKLLGSDPMTEELIEFRKLNKE